MKDIVVTGAGGFVGSHLAEQLVINGFTVKAFIRYNSRNSWGWLENSIYKKEIQFISGDIRDYDSVSHAIKGTDTVFHLAALIGIPYSYLSPLAYIKTNVIGTYNILQAAKEFDLEQVLITSTSETYGTAQYIPIDENHPLVGQSPYSASKISADQLAISYHRSFGLPVKIVRPFNTYGPRQSARAIIPAILFQIIKNQPLNLGSLTPTRDLSFVKDTVEGFIAIAQTSDLIGEVVNIGMNEEISINELVNIIFRLLKNEKEIKLDPQRIRPSKSEVERLKCDNKKILGLTNWRPKYNLEKGLVETIAWIKENINIYKSEIYNV